MIRKRWFAHPLSIFIFSLLALGFSLFLYIHSYIRVNDAFAEFVRKRNLNPDQFLETQTWVMILTLSLLVALIIFGFVVIFIYYQKVIQLYRMQQNFINGFTHELKTPIASLGLFIDTFERHELSKDQQSKYLGFMKRDVDRLSVNVNQILNLAKLEDKKYEGEFSLIEVKTYLKSLIEKWDHFTSVIDISVDESNSEWVSIDYLLMDMVISNLIQNAVTYNCSSEPKLHISFKKQGKYLLIIFEDNGIGISKKEEKNIFKKFYQIAKTGKGSGLGLYLVTQIMKHHKGSVHCHSNGLDMGTSFILQLPISDKGTV